MPEFRVGTAGWCLPKQWANEFASDGTHLTRYASRLTAVEINSSFYKEHMPKSYARWACETPPGFKFSVKLEKKYTHEQKLAVDADELALTLAGIQQLREKLGVLLVQLPPKLAFERETVVAFFEGMRRNFSGRVALEPRHPTWGSRDAVELISDFDVTRVIADPDPCGFLNQKHQGPFAYLRLHGSPEVYRTRYEGARIESWAKKIENLDVDERWMIFDNTTFGDATANALEMKARLEGKKDYLRPVLADARPPPRAPQLSP